MKKRNLSLIIVSVALIAAAATGPAVWNYTKSNKFCDDCHKNMDFPNQEALAQGLSENHYDTHFDNQTQKTACLECHSGEGISGTFDAKVKQASRELYYYFVLDSRELPRSGEYKDGYCSKTGCHPNASASHLENEIDIGSKNCISCHSGHYAIHSTAKNQSLGQTLDCQRCHSRTLSQTHVSQEAMENCTDCHDQTFLNMEPDSTCGQCHDEELSFVQDGGHQALDCVSCHQNHTESLDCQSCHGLTHGTDELLTNCSSCHTGGGHQPAPVELETNEQCQSCHNLQHGEVYSECQSCHTDPHT